MSAVAKAFQIGRVEAQAMMALSTGIHPTVCRELRAAVAKRGMRWFITNDLVAKGVFNVSWTSASGPTESWAGHLTNGSDHRLVPRLIYFEIHQFRASE